MTVIVKYIFNTSRFVVRPKWYIMMMSSNGNIFRITGQLCGEFSGPRWIPRTKASGAELWLMFSMICFWINDWVNNRKAGDLRHYRAHYDVTVMVLQQLWVGQDEGTMCFFRSGHSPSVIRLETHGYHMTATGNRTCTQLWMFHHMTS